MAEQSSPSLHQTLVGVGAIGVGAVLAYGATFISSEAGYAGVGPNFLPWVVAVVLIVCGAWLVFEARTGGYREVEEPSGAGTVRAATLYAAFPRSRRTPHRTFALCLK